MTEPPVDLDALEKWLIDNQNRSKFTLDAGINIDDANLFRDAIAELRELRAWKARLGPPESWFPSLDFDDSMFHTAEQAYSAHLTQLEKEVRALLGRAKEPPC